MERGIYQDLTLSVDIRDFSELIVDRMGRGGGGGEVAVGDATSREGLEDSVGRGRPDSR